MGLTSSMQWYLERKAQQADEALRKSIAPKPPESLATRSGSWPLSQIPGRLFNIRESGAGVDVDQDSAMSLSAVFAAVSKLSSITAALPLSVYRLDGRNRKVADTHKAHRLLHTEYNSEMSAFVARRTVEFHRLLWGNGYTEINWSGASQVEGLYPIEPWRVKPKRNKAGELGYEVAGESWIKARDMLHETLISADGVIGQSFIDYAVSSLGLSIAAQEFSERYFGNGTHIGGNLHHEGTPKEEQRKEMRESWERTYGGSDNAHKTAVTWGNWKFQRFEFNAEDQQLLDTRRFTTEEVARWLNIPPHIIYDLSRSTNNNIEHQGIEFVQHCLGPTLVLKEQEIDRKLLNPPKLYAKHNVTALLRGDSAARADFYSKLLNVGIITINEARELEELNPIGPDGDVHFVPVNMQPIDRAIKPPEPPAPVVQPPVNEPPTEEEIPDEPPEEMPEMRAALRSLLQDTFARLMRKEINEGRRAAKKPGEFLAWLDSFYGEFQSTLTDALGAPLAMANAISKAALCPEIAAGEHCQRSKESLLELAGNVTAAKLATAVDAEFEAWEANRAADEAKRLIGD